MRQFHGRNDWLGSPLMAEAPAHPKRPVGGSDDTQGLTPFPRFEASYPSMQERWGLGKGGLRMEAKLRGRLPLYFGLVSKLYNRFSYKYASHMCRQSSLLHLCASSRSAAQRSDCIPLYLSIHSANRRSLLERFYPINDATPPSHSSSTSSHLVQWV